jgi:hypothetical protein
MPVIRDIPLSLKIEDVLRRQGIRKHSEVRAEINILIRELLASVSKAHLLEPSIAYEIYTITDLSQRQLPFEDDPEVHDSLLSSVLDQATEFAVAVCTIGPRLEGQASDYFNQGKPLQGTLLDGIGSAAVDSLSEEVCKLIAEEASARGYEASSPFSPGMLGLPITSQRQLLELVPAQEIRVSLTSSGIMVPRKSASMVMGIGPQMVRWTRAEVCARCHLKETCPYGISA